MKLFYEKYIKLAHIGKGANAHVYKVRHANLGYVRAIKVLNDYIENKEDKVYKSFLNECRTLLKIGNGCHPNIVRIYSPDLIDNHAVVEMDYVQGVTLDSYIKQHGFIAYAEVLRFIEDIVGAMAYTHHGIYSFMMDPNEDNLQSSPTDGSKYLISPEKEKELVQKYGISHNDLHSNNVMRSDYDGRFILLDFGLAVQDGQCIKSSHKHDGSPEYCAPEKIDLGVVTPQSDVYSLGILMYEMLAGRVPFVLELDSDGRVTPRSIHMVYTQHTTATPPPIISFRQSAFKQCYPNAVYERDYPEWLDAVIMKCLSKKPEDRYADAHELFVEIHHYLEQETVPEKEVDNLKTTLQQVTEKWESDKKEKEELERVKQNLEDALENLKQEKADLASQMNRIADHSSNIHKDTISKINAQLEQGKKEIAELQRTNQQLEQEKADLTSQMMQILDDSSNLQKIADLESTTNRLMAKTRTWKVSTVIFIIFTCLASTLAIYCSFSQTAYSPIGRMDTLQANRDSTNVSNSMEIQRLQKENATLKAEIKKQETSHDGGNNSAAIQRLQKENATLKEEIKKQKTSNANGNNSAIQRLQKENDNLKAENKKLQGRIDKIISTL